MSKMIKAFSADISVDEGERAVVATITTAAVDREGEVLIPQGCYSKDFEKNPVVFLNHDYWTLPVGQCVSIKRNADSIVAKTVFASRPESYPAEQEWLPDTLFELYKQKVIRGFSVGFMPIEHRPASDKDIEKFGAGCRRVYSKWNLFEYSVAPLPANQEAITMAVSKGYVKAATAKAMFGESSVAELPVETESPTGSSALIVDSEGEYHAGEIVGESAAGVVTEPAIDAPADQAAVVADPATDAAVVEPEVVHPKRLTVFVPSAALPKPKRLSIVQIANHAAQKARGAVYANE